MVRSPPALWPAMLRGYRNTRDATAQIIPAICSGTKGGVVARDRQQDGWIALGDLSHALGVTRTAVRSIVAKAGIHPHRIVTQLSRGQSFFAVTPDEAQAVLQDRLARGYALYAGVPDPVQGVVRIMGGQSAPPPAYSLLLICLDYPQRRDRVWIGGSHDAQATLRVLADIFGHTRQRIAATWPCRVEWTDTGRAAVVGVDGISVGLPGWHVYSLPNGAGGVDAAIYRGGSFFAAMPPIGSAPVSAQEAF